MEKEFTMKIDMDTKTLKDGISDAYLLEDLQKLMDAVNHEVLKEELFQKMCKELDVDHLKCPKCGSEHIIKNGKTPQGLQRYKCPVKNIYPLICGKSCLKAL